MNILRYSFINYLGLLDDIIEKHEHSEVQFHKLPWFTSGLGKTGKIAGLDRN